MIKQLSHLISAAIFLTVSSHSVQAATYQDVTLGGVNLTPWCKSQFGSNFKASRAQGIAGRSRLNRLVNCSMGKKPTKQRL